MKIIFSKLFIKLTHLSYYTLAHFIFLFIFLTLCFFLSCDLDNSKNLTYSKEEGSMLKTDSNTNVSKDRKSTAIFSKENSFKKERITEN